MISNFDFFHPLLSRSKCYECQNVKSEEECDKNIVSCAENALSCQTHIRVWNEGRDVSVSKFGFSHSRFIMGRVWTVQKKELSIFLKIQSKHRQVISSRFPKSFRGAGDLVL